MIIMDINNCYQPLNEDCIATFENKYGISFPDEFKQFYLKYNGGIPERNVFTFVDTEGNLSDSLIQYFLAFHDEDRYDSFETIYWLYTLQDRTPKNIVPFARDPFGNYICISVDGDDRGQIFFWDHELEPDIPSYENLSLINDSITDFLNRLGK